MLCTRKFQVELGMIVLCGIINFKKCAFERTTIIHLFKFNLANYFIQKNREYQKS